MDNYCVGVADNLNCRGRVSVPREEQGIACDVECLKHGVDKGDVVCYKGNTDNTDGTDDTERRGEMEKLFLPKRDVYLEIAQRYEKYITLGVIKPGEKLPSVRTAATELRVNPNTVQRAYALLEEKGMIRSMPKKGAFVIFGSEDQADCRCFEVLTSEVLRLKEQGASKEQIASIIEEVYKND